MKLDGTLLVLGTIGLLAGVGTLKKQLPRGSSARGVRYINRRGDGYTETVDEFDTEKEARAMLREYQMSDPTGELWVSRRPIKGWSDPYAQHLG